MTCDDALTCLAERADAIRNLLPFATRPFVIEFAGTPKAGKSTSVDAIAHFFRRSRFRERVLTERASLCPIPMKGHLFFNTWCTCTMLAEMLENVETPVDIIIKDRGVFDSLIWLRRQITKGEVTADEVERIENFVLMDRWTRLVNLVVLVTVNPKQAIERELAPRLTTKPGSIMNPDALNSINDALNEASQNYIHHFRSIKTYDTTDSSPKKTNILIARDILDHLEKFLDPEIMVIDRSRISDIPLYKGGCFRDPDRATALRLIEDDVRFVKRSDAEKSDTLVQIIPCGILRHEGRILLFQRPEEDPKYRLYGRSSLWQGAHVARATDTGTRNMLTETLNERLKEKLFISRRFSMDYLGCAYDDATPESTKHLGVLYEVSIDNDDVADDLQKKEFRSGRGFGLYGQFLRPTELKARGEEIRLEPWSEALLNNESGSI